MRTQGVETALITLHVGIGTFAPVRVQNLQKHSMEPEWVDISEDGPTASHRHKTERRESLCGRNDDDAGLGGRFGLGGSRAAGATGRWPFQLSSLSVSGCRWSRHNFHLPRSTLIMLVCLPLREEPRDASLSRSH
jgi:S-adenosylmethionine:tRNA ribosyltransferase-isomerase